MMSECRSVIDCIVVFLVVEPNVTNLDLMLDISVSLLSDRIHLVKLLKYLQSNSAVVHSPMISTNSSEKKNEENIL